MGVNNTPGCFLGTLLDSWIFELSLSVIKKVRYKIIILLYQVLFWHIVFQYRDFLGSKM